MGVNCDMFYTYDSGQELVSTQLKLIFQLFRNCHTFWCCRLFREQDTFVHVIVDVQICACCDFTKGFSPSFMTILSLMAFLSVTISLFLCLSLAVCFSQVERCYYFLHSCVETAQKNEPVDGRLVQFLLSNPTNDGGQWDMLVNLIGQFLWKIVIHLNGSQAIDFVHVNES